MSNPQLHQDPSDQPIQAIVAKVLDTYVVTYPCSACGDLSERDSVTFSLCHWQGSEMPEHGQVVELMDTCLWANGWRARDARPVMLQFAQQ